MDDEKSSKEQKNEQKYNDDDVDSVHNLKLTIRNLFESRLRFFNSPFSPSAPFSFKFCKDLNLHQLDNDQLSILKLLSEKVHGLYKKNFCIDKKLIESAKTLALNSNNDVSTDDELSKYTGWNASIQSVWDSFLSHFNTFVSMLVNFVKELPGYNQICFQDMTRAIYEAVFPIFSIIYHKFFINNQCFLMISENIQLTREWILRFVGKNITDKIFAYYNRFSELNLTSKEIALILPIILTSPSKFY